MNHWKNGENYIIFQSTPIFHHFSMFNYECLWKKVVWLVQSSTNRRVKLRSITFYNYNQPSQHELGDIYYINNHWCGSNWLPCLHMFTIVHCNFSWFSWGSNRFFLWSGWRMLELHLPLWKIMDFVSWDDEIPNCFWKVIIHSMVPVTTNRCIMWVIINHPLVLTIYSCGIRLPFPVMDG